MKKLNDLSRNQLEITLSKIQDILWLDLVEGGYEVFNPDKQWSPKTLDQIAEAMAQSGLRPTETGLPDPGFTEK